MREEEKISKRIRELLPEGKWKIFQAMSYTPLAGGKLLRSKIMLSVAEDVGIAQDKVLDAAVALELLHSGTLIHDDMPEIDNATTRRGKKALHRVFGEGMALLAGDGLFFLSFKIMSNYPELFPAFSKSAYDVLIGEAIDVELEDMEDFSENDIYDMYEKKTGALFGFAFSAPAILKGAVYATKLEQIGRKFGVAFQIMDDVKDVIGDSETMGKDTGMDEKKKTLVKLIGVEKALDRAEEIYSETIAELERIGAKRTSSFLNEVKELVRKG